MPNNENLSWLLSVSADTAGAAKFAKALKDGEAQLGAVDKATSKTERAMEEAGHKAAKMGEEAAEGHRRHASAVEHASDAYHRHRYETEGVGKELREAAGRAHEFAEAIGIIAAFEIFHEGIEVVREMGMEILRTSAEAERMDKSFQLRFGMEGGKEAIEYAERFAKNTEFTDNQTKGFVSELGRAGVPLEEMDRYMAAAGDMAAMTGDKVQGMAGAISGLSRARMTGVIDSRELLKIGIGVDEIRKIPEFARKSKEELHALMKPGGEFTEEQLFRVIASKGPETNNVGDVATQMAGTMGAQLDKLAALPEQYMEKFRNSKGFDGLKVKFGEILGSLDPDGPRGGRIFSSLERSFDHIAGIVGGIDFDRAAQTFETEVLPDIEGIASAIAKVDWVSGIKGMLSVAEGIGQIFSGIQRTLDAMPKSPLAALSEVKNADSATKSQLLYGETPDELESDPDKNLGKGKLAEVVLGSTYDERMKHGALSRFGSGALRAVKILAGVVSSPFRDDQVGDKFGMTEAGGGASSAETEGQEVGMSTAASAVHGARDTAGFERAGQDAAAGYVRGMTSSADDIGEAGAMMAKAALKGTATAQDSHSPSRKFARLGGDAVDGYVDELADGAGDARRAGADLAGAGIAGADSVPSRARRAAMGLGDFDPGSVAPGVADPAGPSGASEGQDRSTSPAPAFAPSQPSAGAGARAVTITIPITISVGDGARPRDAEQAVERLRTMLPGALTSALEQLGIEAGV